MKISKEARRTARQLIRLTTREGRVNELTARSIVAKLTAEKPRHYIGILSNYHRMLRLEIAKRHAIVESAAELNEGERNSVLSDLQKKHGADITAEYRISPALLGGLRVTLGSTVWDGSMKARLEALRSALLA